MIRLALSKDLVKRKIVQSRLVIKNVKILSNVLELKTMDQE